MSNSYKLSKGFLVDYDWMESIDTLSDREAGKLLLDLLRYQRSRGKIPLPKYPEKSRLNVLAPMIVCHINRRLDGAKAAEGGRSEENAGTEAPTLPTGGEGTPPKEKIKTKTREAELNREKTDCADAPPSEEQLDPVGQIGQSEKQSETGYLHTEEDIRALYEILCPTLLPGKRDEETKKAILRAASHLTDEEIRQLFMRAEKTPFLCGKGRSGWKPTLLWVLENADRITKGEFDPRPTKTDGSLDSPNTPGSFETDEFYNLALRRSYGPNAPQA